MSAAREIRFVLATDDYDSAAHLYREVFGLEVVMDLEGQGGRGVILRLPEATLELVDAGHRTWVDVLEVGRPVDEAVRIAVRVDDLIGAARAVALSGATPMADVVATPWGDRNQRFRASDGMQLTLFQAP
jgi:catechol 2,3-dioxygenase-like lactoylglutathione lyase family enzyme